MVITKKKNTDLLTNFISQQQLRECHTSIIRFHPRRPLKQSDGTRRHLPLAKSEPTRLDWLPLQSWHGTTGSTLVREHKPEQSSMNTSNPFFKHLATIPIDFTSYAWNVCGNKSHKRNSVIPNLTFYVLPLILNKSSATQSKTAIWTFMSNLIYAAQNETNTHKKLLQRVIPDVPFT